MRQTEEPQFNRQPVDDSKVRELAAKTYQPGTSDDVLPLECCRQVRSPPQCSLAGMQACMVEFLGLFI